MRPRKYLITTIRNVLTYSNAVRNDHKILLDASSVRKFDLASFAVIVYHFDPESKFGSKTSHTFLFRSQCSQALMQIDTMK
jgi:hypothetical protein